MSSNGALGVRVRERVDVTRVRVREGRRAAVAVGTRGEAGVGVGVGVQVRLVVWVDVARPTLGQAVLVVEQRGGFIRPVLSGGRQRYGVVAGGGHGRG